MDPDYFVSEDHEKSVIINIHDPKDYISSAALVNAIKPLDSAIDLIGVVKQVQNPENVQANGKTMTVFSFTLEMQDEIQLPVSVWDEDIPRFKPFAILNHIIHLDSPFARPQKVSTFTNGRKYLLTCRSNTIVNTLARLARTKSDDHNASLENIKKFSNINECLSSAEINEEIVLTVAVKIEFKKENDKFSKRIGAVTDGSQKLTVYIIEYDDSLIFNKGEFIDMFGKLKENKSRIYFEVQQSNNITKLKKEKLSQEILSGVTKMAKRKAVSTESDLSNITNKSMKSE